MKKALFIFLINILLVINSIAEDKVINNIYWYNIPPINNINIGGKTIRTQTFLHFKVNYLLTSFRIRAIDSFGVVMYEKTIDEDECVILFDKAVIQNDSFYRIEIETIHLNVPPTTIIIQDGKKEYITNCKYELLHGYVENENDASNKYIGIIPDDFNNNNLILKTTCKGQYSCLLPIRQYNAIYAIASSWGTSTLEDWFWNYDHTNETIINFKIGTIEIYNLHAWKNNGGGNTLFVSFRPMINKKSVLPQKITLNNKTFKLFDYSIDFSIDDIKIKINNTLQNIISVQRILETNDKNVALYSYLIQIQYGMKNEKQILEIELEKQIDEHLLKGRARINFK